jgi:fido (protein-threonine AMPylation protein)
LDLNEFKKLHNDVVLNDSEFEFLKQSNYIEAEYGTKALSDAIHAWDYLRTCAGLNITNVLHCHYILMVYIDSSIAGKVRECDVWIGGVHKPFISTQLIKGNLNHLLIRIAKRKIEPKAAHIEFEFIHPFVDGNGRVGRMIYNAHRLQLGQPIHIIKESEKHEYYKWF